MCCRHGPICTGLECLGPGLFKATRCRPAAQSAAPAMAWRPCSLRRTYGDPPAASAGAGPDPALAAGGWVIAASLGGMPTTRVRPWKTGLLSAPFRSPETCRRNRRNLSSSPKGFCKAVGRCTVGDRHGGAAAQGRAARRPGRRALRQRQAGRRAAAGAPAPAGAD